MVLIFASQAPHLANMSDWKRLANPSDWRAIHPHLVYDFPLNVLDLQSSLLPTRKYH